MQRQNKQSKLTSYFHPNNAASTPQQPSAVKCKKRGRELHSTASLEAYFKKANPSKRSKTTQKILNCQANMSPAPIGIAYRNDGDGRGAAFDHRTFQLATNKPTAALNTAHLSRDFESSIRAMPGFLKYGEKIDRTDFKFPPIANAEDQTTGLIVIPGVSAKSFKSPNHAVRLAQEKRIIQRAKNTGQPILGVCGGAWTLYQEYGGDIKPVTGHSYRGGMPRLNTQNATPCNNKQMHRIKVKKEAALLSAALAQTPGTKQTLEVNSVHSFAPDEKQIPENLAVSAIATPDPTLAPATCKTTEKSIEAFESIHGTPHLGIQWHPEAYTGQSPHRSLIQYMYNAGQSFFNKKAIQTELTEDFNNLINGLNKTRKLSYNHGVIRREINHQIHFHHFKLQRTDTLRHEDEAKIEIEAKENFLIERLANA